MSLSADERATIVSLLDTFLSARNPHTARVARIDWARRSYFFYFSLRKRLTHAARRQRMMSPIVGLS